MITRMVLVIIPIPADNTQAIIRRPLMAKFCIQSNIQWNSCWNGTNYFALEDSMNVSKGFAEDSQGQIMEPW